MLLSSLLLHSHGPGDSPTTYDDVTNIGRIMALLLVMKPFSIVHGAADDDADSG